MGGEQKLVIVTAPSGSGKTTIVHHLIKTFPDCAFSVSATTRAKRAHEEDGKDYFFLSVDAFKQKIAENAFIEWEEVYPGKFYGTLYSEVYRLWDAGKHVLFDVDVQGALDLKAEFPKRSLTIYLKVPSLELLRERLIKRGTESPESLEKRIQKAAREMKFENRFDLVVMNKELAQTLVEVTEHVRRFLYHEEM